MRVAFDDFVFDSDRRELLDGARPIHLGPKAFGLLEALIEERPKPMRKEDLCERIWPDTVVDESNLAGLINELRSALKDRARKPRFIRTVHRFGYAFCGEAKAADAPPPAGFVIFQRQQFALHVGVNVLGRDPHADVWIDDGTVSRRHAAITVAKGSATIEDLKSKNGTFVGGMRIDGISPLGEAQSIVLGDASITFRRSPSAGSTVSVSRLKTKRQPQKRT